MSKFEELKRKVIEVCPDHEIGDYFVYFKIGNRDYDCTRDSSDSLIEMLLNILDSSRQEVKVEVDQIIKSRSNGTYDDISDTASEIIKSLGTDSKYTYFFTQIANKLARIKNDYSAEDSLLDIAGYATLELERLRNDRTRED